MANSRNFGIPQNRPRVYIVGFDKKRYGDFLNDVPMTTIPKGSPNKIYSDLEELLELGAEPKYYLSEGYLETLKRHRTRHVKRGNGYGYIVVNDPKNPLAYSNAILATGGSGKERNLVYDPQPELSGMVVGSKQTPLNKEGIRLMTPVEWGKLQGFINYAFMQDGKDKFSFPESISNAQQYKQFGNAVTIPVVESIAECMASALDFLDHHSTHVLRSNSREDEISLIGNKGEWSEFYTFVKLMADGKFYAADENLEKIESIFYPVLKVIRHELGMTKEYRRNGSIIIVDAGTGNEIASVPISHFEQHVSLLLEKIKEGSSAFSIPEVEPFLKEIAAVKLKAGSGDKRDITIMVHDEFTGLKPELGFSIKSKLGQAPTLFNTSGSTQFIYELVGERLNDNLLSKVNSLNPRQGKIRARIQEIQELGCSLQYINVSSPTFRRNLQIVDSRMPELLSALVYYYYCGEGSHLTDLLDLLVENNPLGCEEESSRRFYEYKVKSILTDIALGMTAKSPWNGVYDATGGYLVVRQDGEVVCYHIYNRNEFQNYLINNTKLDTPSSGRWDFGSVYKENGRFYIKLNLQIRFK